MEGVRVDREVIDPGSDGTKNINGNHVVSKLSIGTTPNL